MSASEGENTTIDNLGSVVFGIGYFLPRDETNTVVIRLKIEDNEFYLRADQALGLAALINQTVHTADAVRYALQTHCALTHNSSDKRRDEFLDAIHKLMERA